ncbi:hypothetical protein ERJ77_10260 [Vibrio anguillarum]|uniref:Uncharacterized protein n=1 Tax=Vibrio anguillarum TaxID=55601 RepID=A0AAW4BEX5_VIBAN|nr:hypothetical protein [Vibrio anguillarum]
MSWQRDQQGGEDHATTRSFSFYVLIDSACDKRTLVQKAKIICGKKLDKKAILDLNEERTLM